MDGPACSGGSLRSSVAGSVPVTGRRWTGGLACVAGPGADQLAITLAGPAGDPNMG